MYHPLHTAWILVAATCRSFLYTQSSVIRLITLKAVLDSYQILATKLMLAKKLLQSMDQNDKIIASFTNTEVCFSGMNN